MSATAVATGVLNIVLVVAIFASAIYMLAVLFNRILSLFDPFARARNRDYAYRTNREAMAARMPYRPGSLTIAAEDEEEVADALIVLTRQRPAAM